MTYKIAMSTHKGGVGKTSLTLQIGHVLANAGLKTLVVDFDPQGNCSSRIFTGEYTGTPVHNLFEDELDEVVPVQCSNNLWGLLVPIDPETEDLIDEMVDIQDRDESCLINPARHIQAIEDDFDIILYDTPPNLGNLLVSAILAASHIVIPIEPAGFARAGVSQIYDTISKLQNATDHHVEVIGFVFNKVRREVGLHRNAIASIREAVGELVFDAQVGNRSRVDIANTEKKPLSQYKDGAGRTVYKEVYAVTKEMLQRLGAKKLIKKGGFK